METLKQIKEIFLSETTIILCLIVIKLAISLQTSTIVPFITLRLAEFNSTGFLMGLTLSCMYISSFVSTLFFGHFSEWSQVGRTIIITIGLTAMGATFNIIAHSRNLWQIAICLTFSGFGLSAAQSIIYAIVLDIYPKRLTVIALTTIEMSEAIGWTIGPATFGKIWQKSNNIKYSLFTVGTIQLVISCVVMIIFSIKLSLKYGGKKAITKYTKISLLKKFKLIFLNFYSIIVISTNFTNCFCYYAFATTFSLHIQNLNTSIIIFSLPSAILGILLVPMISKKIDKTKFIIGSLPIMSICYFLISDTVFSKSNLSVAAYTTSIAIVVLIKDTIYCISYPFCNLILMQKIAQFYPKFELNGVSAGLFFFSTTLGDAVGVILGNVLLSNVDFNLICYLNAALLMTAFFVNFGIYYFFGKNGNFEKSFVK